MSHAISIRANGFAEMAFTGQTPWHGLGQSLDANATVEQWIKASGFDWRVQRSKVRYQVQAADANGLTPDTAVRVWDDRHVLFRSDTGAPLGLVSDGYKVVQPKQVAEFFAHVAEENKITLETMGMLHGGRVYWALAKLGPEFSIGGVDRIRAYAMLATSTDGSLATTAKQTDIRVVCANTIALALGDSNKAIKVKHSTRFDAQSVRIEMGLVEERWAEVERVAAKLATVRLSKQQALTVLVDAIGDSDAFIKAIREDKKTPREAAELQPGYRGMAEILRLFDGAARGSQSITAQNTAWGLLNAATEYYDHFAGRGDDSRLNSAWFGVNEGRKQSILSTLLKVEA